MTHVITSVWDGGKVAVNMQLQEAAREILSRQNEINIIEVNSHRPAHEWPIVKIESSVSLGGAVLHVDWDVLWDYDLSRITDMMEILGVDVLYQRRDSIAGHPVYARGLQAFPDAADYIAYNAGVTYFSASAAKAVSDMGKIELDCFEESCTYEQIVLPHKLRSLGFKVATLEDVAPFLSYAEPLPVSMWESMQWRWLIKSKCYIPSLRFLHLVGDMKTRIDLSKILEHFK